MNSGLSEEFKVIMERPPSWFVRCGQGILVGLVAIFFILAYLLQYPNSIQADVSIVSLSPRIKIVFKSSGYLQLAVKNNQKVKKGQVLSVVRSSIEDIDNISRLHNKLDQLYYKDLFNEDLSTFKHEIYIDEIQPYYDEFLKRIRNISIFKQLDQNRRQTQFIAKKLRFIKGLKASQNSKRQILNNKLVLHTAQMNDIQQLYMDNVVTKDELQQLKKTLMEHQTQVVISDEDNIQLQITENELIKQLNDIESQNASEKLRLNGELKDAFTILLSVVKQWEVIHVLKAPIDGTVFFKENWGNSQMISANDEFLSVVPANEKMFAIAKVKSSGAGEIKSGQEVRISLLSYPVQEYGIINGQVASISPVLTDENYTVLVNLPRGLLSSYGHNLSFTPELHGSGEILTKKMSLLHKLFYRFRTLSPSN